MGYMGFTNKQVTIAVIVAVIIIVGFAVAGYYIGKKTETYGVKWTFTTQITPVSGGTAVTAATLSKTGWTELTDDSTTANGGPLTYKVSDFGKTITMYDPAKIEMATGALAETATTLTITWTAATSYSGKSGGLIPAGTWTTTVAAA